MSASQLKPLILLCDGTWCGRETSTKTNIYLLAKMIGIPIENITDTDEHFIPQPDPSGRKARYIHGVGLGSTFLDYIFNGITAQDIAEQCIAAYKYIVMNYIHDEYEIWMFGLSRGAFTIRCVAGMINNCGIIKRTDLTNNEIDLLCREVYRIYRSRYVEDEPHSPQSTLFRKHASWPLIGDDDPDTGHPIQKSPIRFMGLFDTVGSLGIPTFTGGVGLEWPQFYDQDVSSVVEYVYQAVSLHDRIYVFQPCLARRNLKKFPYRATWNIHEKWFPGVHYDLGRQRFKFFRGSGGKFWEGLLSRLGWVSKVIEPNHVLGDLVLKWMLDSIKKHDTNSLIVRNSDEETGKLKASIVSENRKTGDGDVYNRIVDYAPFGGFGLAILGKIQGPGGKVNAIWELLFALRDRHIPDNGADVYDYKVLDLEISTVMSIQELAKIEPLTGDRKEDEKKRYPSSAFEAWNLRRRISP